MAKTAKKKASAKVEKTTVKPVSVVKKAEAVATAPAQDASALSIADLQSIAQVIDAAVRRGAFGASEVTEVGAIYTKLTGFLQVISEQQRAAEGGE